LQTTPTLVGKTIRRVEIVPLDAAVARIHAHLWQQLSAAGLMIGPHDLIVAAPATHRRWPVVTFNAAEFRHVRGLVVIEP
jgi:predicted nucleic acid-binding protein